MKYNTQINKKQNQLGLSDNKNRPIDIDETSEVQCNDKYINNIL